MNNKILFYTLLGLSTVLHASCSEDWLEERPDKSLIVPESISDFQALLDNTSYFNVCSGFGEVSSDDYRVTYDGWLSLRNQYERNLYIWEKKDLYGGALANDWYVIYRAVFVTNIILEGLETVPRSEETNAREHIKGAALFHRAWNFYQAAQLFAPVYSPETAETDLGIPIKLSSLVSSISTRSSLQETYDQIIRDLKEAVTLLPDTPEIKTRASKAAALALLAKVSLLQEQYEDAIFFARECLEINNDLIDLNDLELDQNNTFTRFNEEVIFETTLSNYAIITSDFTYVDESLLNVYDLNDLRREAFFQNATNGYHFKGSYSGAPQLGVGALFGGIATDEIYLLISECLARIGQVHESLTYLNRLLENRYNREEYTPLTTNSAEDLLIVILKERRKELAFRGVRFSDLRRLNKEERFMITIQRQLNGKTYQLPPNDLRYTLPIPDEVILSTGMSQNPR